MPAEATVQAQLHDDSTIAVEVHGQGPTVLLPVNPQPVEGPQGEEMRKWGVDPALGRSLIDGLPDAFPGGRRPATDPEPTANGERTHKTQVSDQSGGTEVLGIGCHARAWLGGRGLFGPHAPSWLDSWGRTTPCRDLARWPCRAQAGGQATAWCRRPDQVAVQRPSGPRVNCHPSAWTRR